MSAAAPPATKQWRVSHEMHGESANVRESPWIRLACFAALALWAAAHWGALVEDPDGARTFGVVLTATAGGALLLLLARSSLAAPTALRGRHSDWRRHRRRRPRRCRPSGAPAQAGQLGRARRRARPRSLGRPHDRLALRRRRGLGAARGPAGCAAADRIGGIACLLAGPPRSGRPPRNRARAPPGALRDRGDRARPGRGARPRARAARARGGVAVASAPAPARGPARRGAGARDRRGVAARGGPARRGRALVGLPRVELVRGRQDRRVRLEPLVRAARLAPRRHHAPEREGGSRALLEGRDARLLRRLPLGPLRPERLHRGDLRASRTA